MSTPNINYDRLRRMKPDAKYHSITDVAAVLGSDWMTAKRRLVQGDIPFVVIDGNAVVLPDVLKRAAETESLRQRQAPKKRRAVA